MAIKTCFFIGHREATEEIYPLLAKEVERHGAELGVEEFVVGQLLRLGLQQLVEGFLHAASYKFLELPLDYGLV